MESDATQTLKSHVRQRIEELEKLLADHSDDAARVVAGSVCLRITHAG